MIRWRWFFTTVASARKLLVVNSRIACRFLEIETHKDKKQRQRTSCRNIWDPIFFLGFCTVRRAWLKFHCNWSSSPKVHTICGGLLFVVNPIFLKESLNKINYRSQFYRRAFKVENASNDDLRGALMLLPPSHTGLKPSGDSTREDD